MATADAVNSQPCSAQGAVLFDGFQKILRAGGLETAAGVRPAQPVNDRRNDFLVAPNEEPDDPFHGGSRRSGKQSGAAGKLDPFLLQCRKISVNRSLPRDGDDQVRANDPSLLTPDNGSQSSADFVPRDRISDPLRHREAEFGFGRPVRWKGGKNEQAPGPRCPALTDRGKIAGAANTLSTGQSHGSARDTQSGRTARRAQACVWRA
jgi:hypothetical protein